MTDDNGKLQLDPNPSPRGESKEFENPDDKRRREDKAHELALIDRKQGRIGRFTGSVEQDINFAYFAVSIAGICALGSLIGMLWQASIFSDALKFFGTVILTISGYVFGVKKSSRPD